MKRHDPRSPEGIEARSFEIVADLLPEFDRSRPEWVILQRIVHATGDPSMARLVRIHPSAVEAGVAALRAGGPLLVDVRMVAAGINRRLAAGLGCRILCAIEEAAVADLDRAEGTTRSAAAMARLLPLHPGAVVAIGNAPTALFALLEAVEEGLASPAMVVGTPVGFVGAAESKADMVRRFSDGEGVPYITLEGTRGGSAVAVAAVNALLGLASMEGPGVR